MNFISWKNRPPINLDRIVAFHMETLVVEEGEELYQISFCEPGRDQCAVWEFDTEEERDAVFTKILEKHTEPL